MKSTYRDAEMQIGMGPWDVDYRGLCLRESRPGRQSASADGYHERHAPSVRLAGRQTLTASRTSSLLMLKGDEVSASRRARPSLRARRLTCCRRSTVTGIR